MLGLIVAEYRIERFGEMVCRNQYGYHYKFTGFTDNGNSMHYGCQGDEPRAVALTLSSALDFTGRIKSAILSDEAGTPRPTHGDKEVKNVQ